jgi:hypothetical protein
LSRLSLTGRKAVIDAANKQTKETSMSYATQETLQTYTGIGWRLPVGYSAGASISLELQWK